MSIFGAPLPTPFAPSIDLPGRALRCAGLVLAMATLLGCGQGAPAAATAATDVAFADACDKANDGKRVAVDGYLRLPESFTGDRSVVLHLYETDAHAGSPVGVQVRFGSAANQVATVPTSFSDEDLSLHLDGGGTAGYGTEVNVTGKVYYPMVAQDFACALEDVVVQAAG
jgi:hypothetical protein